MLHGRWHCRCLTRPDVPRLEHAITLKTAPPGAAQFPAPALSESVAALDTLGHTTDSIWKRTVWRRAASKPAQLGLLAVAGRLDTLRHDAIQQQMR